MKYRAHNSNGNGHIQIEPIENGFLIWYTEYTRSKKYCVSDLVELNNWLEKFYKKEV